VHKSDSIAHFEGKRLIKGEVSAAEISSIFAETLFLKFQRKASNQQQA